jgi:FMN phosphatase YigB (HAD superfamily)
MIRAVVFDFGQTLVDSADGFRTAEKELQEKVFAALGLRAWDDFLETYREIRTRFHVCSDFSRKRIMEAVFQHHGREGMPRFSNDGRLSTGRGSKG